MAKPIKPSPKHGLNPTMGQCFWCDGETGEIALLGRLPGDAQAPRRAILSYDPCPACRSRWEGNVAIIEVVEADASSAQPPLYDNFVPTGRHMVMKPAGIQLLVTPPELAQQVISNGQAGVSHEMFTRLLEVVEAVPKGSLAGCTFL